MSSRIIVIAALLLAASVSAASSQTVSGEIAGGSVKVGKSAKAIITLDIPRELHVNSNKPNTEYAIATTVKPAAKGLKLGIVHYPEGENRKFAFSEKPLNVYQGKVSFDFPIIVPGTFRGKRISVDVAVRYQACTEEVCYPPKTKTITLEAPVK